MISVMLSGGIEVDGCRTLRPARMPGFSVLTASPTFTMTPAPSWPAHFVPISDILGNAQSFNMKWISEWQMPVALSLMRTSFGSVRSQ